MADSDGQHMADFTCNDGPMDTVTDPAPADEIAPVVAPPARPTSSRSAAELTTRPEREERATAGVNAELAGHVPRRLEGTLPRSEEERLRAEVTRLRAEAAASRGLLEERQQQANPRANAGGCGRGTRGVSWIEAERNVLACVYKEATLNSAVGVDQTLENFDEDVSDRFRRRLPGDMNQVQRRRARSTPAIMKELRYGIFPGVNRFKECYLAVLRLKMTGHPTPEQLIGAAKAKYNGLNPYDGLNPSVSDKLPCPPLSNWRIIKEIDRFGGGATVVALAGAAARHIPTTPGTSRAEVADLDPLSVGNNDDGEDADLATDGNDDGDGSAPLSSTFSRGKRSIFQARPTGCKAAKAATRAEVHLMREAAANTAALESLADSAAQRTALAFWSTPTAVNSECGRRWWELEMRRRLKHAEDKDKDERRPQDGGHFEMSEAPARRGRGGPSRGVGRRRARAEPQGAPHGDEEEEDLQATHSGGGRGRAPSNFRGRGRGRCVAPSRGRRSKRTRTVHFAEVTSSSSSSTLSMPASPSPPPLSRPRRSKKVPASPYDDESDDEIHDMGDDNHQVPPPTPVGSQVAPTTSVEAAADAAAALVASALRRDSANDGSSDGVDKDGSLTDKDLDSEVDGRRRRGRANTADADAVAPNHQVRPAPQHCSTPALAPAVSVDYSGYTDEEGA